MIIVMKKAILSCLGLILVLSSCVKEPAPVPTGEARVRFVNAGIASSSQDCYVNSTKKTTVGLTYPQHTPYFTFTNGVTDFIFADEGSTTVGAGTTYLTSIGSSYSVYYLSSGANKASAILWSDDNAVVEGKAKVRFMHLNLNLTNASIKIATESGTVLTEAVGFLKSSSYYTVDPGTKFAVTATGVTNSPLLDGNLQAGKNYTIWLNGATATELIPHVILQN